MVDLEKNDWKKADTENAVSEKEWIEKRKLEDD